MVSSSNELGLSRGRARLEVARVDGQSTVTAAYASAPVRLLTPQPRGSSVWAFLNSYGGGYVAGDQTELEIVVGAGACCFVSTVSATKVYRNPRGLSCSHVGRATVHSEGLLVFAPEPVQAFAQANFHQRQEWRVTRGAGLLLLDWYTSGRVARGELWQFERYESRNDIFLGDGLEVRDSILLEPREFSATLPQRFGSFGCFATMCLVGEPVRRQAADLLREYSGRPVNGTPSLLSSASPLESGAILRLAGESIEAIALELRPWLELFTPLLGDSPWRRKW